MSLLRKMRIALAVLLAAIVIFVVALFPVMKAAVERQLGGADPSMVAPTLSPAPTLRAYISGTAQPAPKEGFDFKPQMDNWRTVLYEGFAGESYLFSSGPDQYNSSGKTTSSSLSISAVAADKEGFAVTNAGQSVDSSLDVKAGLIEPEKTTEFGFVCRYVSSQQYVFISFTPAGVLRAGYVEDGRTTEIPMMMASQEILGANLASPEGNHFRFTCQDKLVNIEVNEKTNVSFMLPADTKNEPGSAGWFVKGPGSLTVGPARLKIPLSAVAK